MAADDFADYLVRNGVIEEVEGHPGVFVKADPRFSACELNCGPIEHEPDCNKQEASK